jgi:hypothetical protein
MDGHRLSVREVNEGGIPQPGLISALPGGIPWTYNIGKPLRRNFGEQRVTGSVCFELLMVANGSYQYALSGFAHTWDFAAGLLLVREAGGATVTLGANGGWVDFTGWAEGYANDIETTKRIRGWVGPVLAGHPMIVQFVGDNLKLRRPSAMQRAFDRLRRKSVRRGSVSATTPRPSRPDRTRRSP